MNDKLAHLLFSLVALIALVLLTITGHDNNTVVIGLLAGVIGGAGPNLTQSFANVGRKASQSGFFRVPFALLLLLLSMGVALLGGCTFFASQTPTQKIEYACATASASLKSLAVVDESGVLTPSEEGAVNRTIAIMRPVCGAPNPPTYTDVAYSALTESIAELQKLQVKYHANSPN